jgi:hypothetical protein
VTPYRRRTVSPTRHRPRLRAREAHRGRRGPGDRAWPRRGLRRVGHGLGRPLPV